MRQIVRVWAALSGLCFASAHADVIYVIIIERTESGKGELVLARDNETLLSAPCQEDDNSAKRIAAKKYTGCSATKTARGQLQAIFFPDEQTGRTGIFLRAGTNLRPGGSIFLDEGDMEKLYAAIEPKDGRNVTVVVRSVAVTKAMAATRALIGKAGEEWKAARRGDDRNAAAEAERLLATCENLYRLQELAEVDGVVELVVKDALLQELAEKGVETGKKSALKAALKKLATRVGRKGIAGPLSVVLDLGWSDDIARDPNEVFRDEMASESELAAAIANTLSLRRNDSNGGDLDESLRLLLRRIGY